MSPLYLYAVLGAAPAAPLGEGLAGEPLRTIHCGAVVAAVGLIAESPSVSPESLRGHDAVVRRLTGVVDALLPARFGTLAPDARGLCERLEGAAADPDAERTHQLGLHRIGQHRHPPAAGGAAEGRGEGPVSRDRALLEFHLPVAINAQEFHGKTAATASLRVVSSAGGNAAEWNGIRASTGTPNVSASADPASPG